MTFAEIKTYVDAFGWYGLAIAAFLAATPRLYSLAKDLIIPAWIAQVERRTAAAERQAQAMVDIAELCKATREDAAETRQSIAGIAERVAVLVDRADGSAVRSAPRRLKVANAAAGEP